MTGFAAKRLHIYVSYVSLFTFLLIPQIAQAQLRLATVASGLNAPVGVVADPLTPAFQYVLQQGGVIRLLTNDTLNPTPFLDISDLVSCCGEQGLLGLAFPPDYQTSRRFYVNYTDKAGNTVVARFLRSTDDYFLADRSSHFALRWGGPSGQRFIVQPFANHNGGHLAFGDGYLYIGMGDGGSANDPQNNAQNPSSLLGKMLRIDVNVPDSNQEGYVIPPDNPFPSGNALGARSEIWAFGLRNPWHFSFDSPALGGTGALLIGDVGQNMWEEVDYQPPGVGGLNYGWRVREGAHPNPNLAPETPAYMPLTDPILGYQHPDGSSITGGVVYRGRAMHAVYRGRYFFAESERPDLVRHARARRWRRCDGERPRRTHCRTRRCRPDRLYQRDWRKSRGEIYFVNYTGGTVMKLVDPTGPGVPRPSTDFYGSVRQGIYVQSPDLVWFNQATRQLAAWGMGGLPDGSRAINGGLLGGPVLPSGWRVVGTSSDTFHNTNLFLQSDDGFLGKWVFDGTGFQYGITLNPGRVSDPMWRVRAVGDFNHDGQPDLVWQYTPTGQVAFWLMNGINAIGYVVPSVAAPGPDWEIFGTGDANFDGERDLYWQHRTLGTLAVWHMMGTNFAEGVMLSESPTDPAWRAVGTVDLDQDAAPDIVFQHATSIRLPRGTSNERLCDLVCT